MTTESIERPAARSGRPALFVVRSCSECGVAVVQVRHVAGHPVQLAAGPDGRAIRDPAGDWASIQVLDEWRVREWDTLDSPLAVELSHKYRYRAHTCQPGAERLLEGTLGAVPAHTARTPEPVPERLLTVQDMVYDATLGWCAGGCQTVVRRFAKPPQMMCPDCREVLAGWRKNPRGPIPYGRRVDGAYQHRADLP